MPDYRVFEDGIEVNRISASEEFMQEHYADYLLIDPPEIPDFQTEFSSVELRNSFTTDEALLALVSPSDAIRAQAQLLMVGRPINHSVDDEGYQSMINGLEDGNVLTAERAASYRLGVPKTEGSV
jgi:hypothetical protein